MIAFCYAAPRIAGTRPAEMSIRRFFNGGFVNKMFPDSASLPRRQFLQTLGKSSLLAGSLSLPVPLRKTLFSVGDVQAPSPTGPKIVPPNKTYRMMEWECHTPPEGNFEINLDDALHAARDSGA